MPHTNLTDLLETPDVAEELETLALDTAAGYSLQTDVRAGLTCPSSTSYRKYKGNESCLPFSPCY